MVKESFDPRDVMQATLLIFDRENKKSILHINWSNLKVLQIFPLCLSQVTFSVLRNIKLKGLITNVFFCAEQCFGS